MYSGKEKLYEHFWGETDHVRKSETDSQMKSFIVQRLLFLRLRKPTEACRFIKIINSSYWNGFLIVASWQTWGQCETSETLEETTGRSMWDYWDFLGELFLLSGAATLKKNISGDTTEMLMRYNLWFVCSYGLFEQLKKMNGLFCYVLMQMFLVKSSGEIKSETIIDKGRI